MQLCEQQRTEDFGVVFEDDVEDGISVLGPEISAERAEEGDDAGSEEETVGDGRDAPDARESAGERGDTTEESGEGAGGGEESNGENTESDSATYKDSDLERDAPPPVSSPRGKSSAPDARSEERRVGKECSEPCRSRWSPYH